jgi:hypothetical protein
MNSPRMRSAVWMEPRLRAEISYVEIVEGPAAGAELAPPQ